PKYIRFMAKSMSTLMFRLSLDKAGVFAFPCRMRKPLSLLLALSTTAVLAQTEPQKSPPLSSATPPANVHDAEHPNAAKIPPPPAASENIHAHETGAPAPAAEKHPP